jgi:hypothetical protein
MAFGNFSNTQNFWTAKETIDPKRNFRFKVQFGRDTIWWAKSVDQPVPTITEASHDFLVHKFYWPSKVTWNEITMEMVDPVVPGTLDGLLAKLQASGYVIPANAQSPFFTISKTQATNQLNASNSNMLIQSIDADGNKLHEWTLYHAFIKEISPSKMSYEDDKLMSVTMKIRYDWAQYESSVATQTGLPADPLFKPRNDRPQQA